MRVLAALAILAVLAGGGVWLSLASPYAGFKGEVVIDFPRGTGTSRMAEILAREGVIRAPWQFKLARIFKRGRTLQAGEYRFAGAAGVLTVYDRIASGDILYHALLVPEGANMFEIGELAARLGFFTAADFLEAARDPSLIRDLDPAAPSLEGYLFPSTYRLNRRTTARDLCRIMTAQFRAVWLSLGSPAGVHQAVILASLVEKEGRLPEERPLIASVFLRRLKLGMKLDCDPTVIYAARLAGRWDGVIHRSDLDSDSPYNTYRQAGLPPGPIANPGLASLRAVIEPAESDDLFFVLRPDGSGGHTFSPDIEGQSRAVARYRNAIRKRK